MTALIVNPGTRVGDYELGEELGAGTSGYVFRAVHTGTGQPAAIKLLKPETLSDSNVLLRFQREVEICCQLQHPNIVAFKEAARTAEDIPYAVFEYIQGETLQDVLIAEGQFNLEETCRLMTGVLDGLCCAHENGVVHRDLKPANIIVSRTGTLRNVHILDFGLGGVVDGHHQHWQRMTHNGECMGTPLYSPREQWEGTETSRPQWDLYAWSLVFLECLLGEHPAHGVLPWERPIAIPEFLQSHRLGELLARTTNLNPEERRVDLQDMFSALSSAPHDLKQVPKDFTEVGRRRFVSILAVRFELGKGEKGDLEEVASLIRRLVELCEEECKDSDGRVVATLGERVGIVFGHPRVHEDDAKRAARCALAIVERTRELSQGRSTDIHVSVGIHSGPVISKGLGATEQLELSGETFETASLLEANCGADEVLVSETTHILLRNQFATGAERSQEGLKSWPVEAVSAMGDEDEPTTPFIGRELELAQLEEAWRRTQDGSGQSRMLVGEAGIGKSRLIREFRERHSDARWLECRCLPERQSIPLGPVVDLLAQSFGALEPVLDELGLDEHQRKILQNLGAGLPPGTDVPYSIERVRPMMLDMFISLAIGLSNRRETVILVEDLHWADPTTMELLTRYEDELEAAETAGQDLPLLLIYSAREPLGVNTKTIEIPRLTARESRDLIASQFADDKEVRKKWLKSVVDRCDGIPLFVEEVASYFGEQGPDPVESVRVPATLAGILNERLDCLSGGALLVTQYAAAWGRSFTFDQLLQTAGYSEDVLRRYLDSIRESGLVLQRQAGYIFKHALVRDAAYESMLSAMRKSVHKNIADLLLKESSQGELVEPEIIAGHLQKAGSLVDASTWWKRAADKATAQGAYLEAIGILQVALAELGQIEDERTRQGVELDLLETLGTAQFSVMGYGAPEVIATFKRAKELSDVLGEEVSARVLWGIWVGHIVHGDPAATENLVHQFQARVDRFGDAVSRVVAACTAATRDLYMGNLQSALAGADTAIELYFDEDYQRYVRLYGYDVGVYAYLIRMHTLNFIGQPVKAREIRDDVLRVARESKNPRSLHSALNWCMNLSRGQGLLEETWELVEEQLQLSEEHYLHGLTGPAHCTRGWLRVMQGDPEGRDEIEQGMSICDIGGVKLDMAFHLSLLADADQMLGNPEAMLASCKRGFEHSEQTIDKFLLPELHRLKGRALAMMGSVDEGAAEIEKGVKIATDYGAHYMALGSAVNLAGLPGCKNDRVRGMIREIYDRIDTNMELPLFQHAHSILSSAQ
jgi:serine/threonine protein kinase/tetratricopeptide (TPR) repeat protein